jgi:hypothetical protein
VASVLGTLLFSSLLLWGLFVVGSSTTRRHPSTVMTSSRDAPSSKSSSFEGGSPRGPIVVGRLEEGTVGGVAYYRCSRATAHEGSSSNGSSSSKAKTLLLFHGAAFTKQNWKESGILKLLCALKDDDGDDAKAPSGARIKADGEASSSAALEVFALDLPVSATARDLKALLDAMQRQSMVRLPADVVVTPSASGRMVVEWDPAQDTALPNFASYASLWMPIASPAVASVKNPERQFPQQLSGVRVVPVYGDQDAAGKRTMTRLAGSVPGSDLVELAGRHPCYLDSPTDFVRLALDQLNVG